MTDFERTISMMLRLVFVIVLVSFLFACTWSDVPVQECYPPDTTGVEDTIVVWEQWTSGEIITYSVLDEWGTIDNTLYAVDDDAWDGSITSAAVTDDTTGVEISMWVDDGWLPLNGDVTIAEWVYPPYSEEIAELLELYKEYEAQCWNDSTFGFWAGDEYPYEAVWIHKAPTFSGFMQYLRKLE